MSSSAALKLRLESVLAHRIPSALTPRPQSIRSVVNTVVVAIDELLNGGLPVSTISEIVGPECSGRTSLALSLVAGLTAEGKLCAWVDVSDTLSPASAAATGIELSRLLWVRCGEISRPPMPIAAMPVISSPVGDALPTRSTQGDGSPHPRGEVRGLDTAVQELMRRKDSFVRDKSLGTPGVRNLPLSFAQQAVVTEFTDKKIQRVEQIPYDRLPSRRGEFVLKSGQAHAAACVESQRNARRQQAFFPATTFSADVIRPKNLMQRKPWSRLDQALRATDLLLQAGGFAAIVLDLGSVAREHARRVPMATWFRYRAAVDKAQASLVLLTQDACAKSSAGLVLRLQGAGEAAGLPGIFNGLAYTAELERQRFAAKPPSNVVPMRKPVQSERGTRWQSATAWTARGAL